MIKNIEINLSIQLNKITRQNLLWNGLTMFKEKHSKQSLGNGQIQLHKELKMLYFHQKVLTLQFVNLKVLEF